MARAGVTVEKLTAAAADLADQIGFENVTISALARRFGVRDASLYSHIKNAHDLKSRVAMEALAEMADRVSEALAGRAGKEALKAFANAYRDYARAHPGRYEAARYRLDPETAKTSAAPRHTELTKALLRAYNLQEEAQTDAIRLLGSTFHGYITLEASGAFDTNPRPSETSWNRALEALNTVLTNWPADEKVNQTNT